MCPSTWSPAIFHCPVRPQFLQLAFLVAFLERVDLHLVAIISTCAIPFRCCRGFSQIARILTASQQCVAKTFTVCLGTQLQVVLEKNRCQIRHHRVLDCICKSCSCSMFPLSNVKRGSTPSVWSHQGFTGIMIFSFRQIDDPVCLARICCEVPGRSGFVLLRIGLSAFVRQN